MKRNKKSQFSKNHGTIQIDYEKIMVSGEKKIKILGISGVKKLDDLPAKYKRSEYCYLAPIDDIRIKFYNGVIYRNALFVNEILAPEDFAEKIALIKECGNRLMKINQEIRKIAKTWHGKRTIKI